MERRRKRGRFAQDVPLLPLGGPPTPTPRPVLPALAHAELVPASPQCGVKVACSALARFVGALLGGGGDDGACLCPLVEVATAFPSFPPFSQAIPVLADALAGMESLVPMPGPF